MTASDANTRGTERGRVDPNDDSFDDPTRHDGHPHYDNYAQLSRWQTARFFLPHIVAGMSGRTVEQAWNSAWTTALDGRNRVHAACGEVPRFDRSDEALAAGELRIGRRRTLKIRRPGDRG